MKFDLDQAALELKKSVSMRLRDAAGATLMVLHGDVWVTQDGTQRDFELNSGDSMTINGNEPVYVTSLSERAAIVLAGPDSNAEHALNDVAQSNPFLRERLWTSIKRFGADCYTKIREAEFHYFP